MLAGMTVRLTIGEFSKMTYLSVKALRHYHDVGLLEPTEVDPSSGYRRYGAEQIGTAQAIRRFRDLDMPLEQVRAVLHAPDEATRNKVILEHLEAMQTQLDRTQQMVTSLHALLAERDAPRPITIRSLPEIGALTIREHVSFDASSDWWDGVFAELHTALDAVGVAAAGPDGALWDDAFFTQGEGECTAYVPVPPKLAIAAGDHGGRVVGRILPGATVAAMVHVGTFDDLDRTYGALGTAVAERGIGLDGPIREIYLADDRCEVCWPVTQGATP
jgi:DNA-binding transcriptional MerR regulator